MAQGTVELRCRSQNWTQQHTHQRVGGQAAEGGSPDAGGRGGDSVQLHRHGEPKRGRGTPGRSPHPPHQPGTMPPAGGLHCKDMEAENGNAGAGSTSCPAPPALAPGQELAPSWSRESRTRWGTRATLRPHQGADRKAQQLLGPGWRCHKDWHFAGTAAQGAGRRDLRSLLNLGALALLQVLRVGTGMVAVVVRVVMGETCRPRRSSLHARQSVHESERRKRSAGTGGLPSGGCSV